MKAPEINKLLNVCMDYSFYHKNIFHLKVSFNILGRRVILRISLSLVDVTAKDIILYD